MSAVVGHKYVSAAPNRDTRRAVKQWRRTPGGDRSPRNGAAPRATSVRPEQESRYHQSGHGTDQADDDQEAVSFGLPFPLPRSCRHRATPMAIGLITRPSTPASTKTIVAPLRAT